VTIREEFDAVWATKWFGIALLTLGILLAGAFTIWTQSPGVSVAVMGAVAAAMAARTKATGLEKAAWMLLIAALLVTEVLAIRKDRKEHDDAWAQLLGEEVAARTEAKNNFAGIGRGIQATIQKSDEHFDKTMKRSDKIMGEVDASIKTQTGADSYLYYECQILGGPIEIDVPGARKGSMILNAYPRLVGHYALHNLHVEVVGPTGWLIGGPKPGLDYGTFGPAELGRSREGLTLSFTPDKPKQFFNVFINASNGSFGQVILVQKIGDHWLWASRLYKGSRKTPVRIWAAKGFPPEELKANAKWD
jgi:hypothetical protein